MMKKGIVFLVCLSVAMMPSAVFAASPWTEEATYSNKTTGKLEFGLKNLLGGWTMIFSTPNRYQNEGKNVWAGAAVGVGEAIVDTIGGGVHTATFPIPVDIPLPNNGVSFE
jgi:hypothetical protein